MSMPASSIACSRGMPSGASIVRASTLIWTVFTICLSEWPSAAVDWGPGFAGTFVLHAVLELYQTVEHSLGPRGTSGYVDVDRDNPIDSLEHGIVVIGAARAGARAE